MVWVQVGDQFRHITRGSCCSPLVRSRYCLLLMAFLLGSYPDMALGQANHRALQPDRVYDCGAISLYIFCKVSDMPLSFEKAVELLPISSSGNSLAEVREAMVKVSGNTIDALMIESNDVHRIVRPVVWLFQPPQGSKAPLNPKTSRPQGHFMVIRPLEGGDLQVLDYPNPPKVFSAAHFASHLKRVGIQYLPILGLSPLSLDVEGRDQVSDSLTVPATDAPPATVGGTSLVTLKANSPRSPIIGAEFGGVAEGSIVRHTFVLHNPLDGPVHITKIQQSCTCTDLQVDRMQIPSGESARIVMTSSLAKRFGHVQISAVVHFSPESGLAPVLLTMHGRSLPRFIPTPAVVDLGNLRSEDPPLVRRVSLKATEIAGGVKLAEARTKSRSLSVGIRTSDGQVNPTSQHDEQVLEIAFDPRSVVGDFSEGIELFVMGEKQPATSVEVRARVESPVSINSSHLFVTDPEKAEGQLTVISKNAKRLKLGKVDVVPAESYTYRPGDVLVIPDPPEGQADRLVLRISYEGKGIFVCRLHLTLVEEDSLQNGPEYQIVVPFTYFPNLSGSDIPE